MRVTAEWLQCCGYLPSLSITHSVTTLECLLSPWASSVLLGLRQSTVISQAIIVDERSETEKKMLTT